MKDEEKKPGPKPTVPAAHLHDTGEIGRTSTAPYFAESTVAQKMYFLTHHCRYAHAQSP